MYPVRMTRAPTLMSRLRDPARLATFMLLVFAMKIAIAGACSRHDFSAIPDASGTQLALAVDAVAADVGSDLTNTAFGHSAGNCSHCNFHDAAAVLPAIHCATAVSPHSLAVLTSGLPPSAFPRLELRPPIV